MSMGILSKYIEEIYERIQECTYEAILEWISNRTQWGIQEAISEETSRTVSRLIFWKKSLKTSGDARA